jgi:hypothetical protein
MDKKQIDDFINEINNALIKPECIGYVYAISGAKTYIGETWTSLNTRAGGHRQSFRQYRKKKSKISCKSTHVMRTCETCVMSILFMLPIYVDEDKQTLLELEQRLISETDCVNKCAHEEERSEVDEEERSEVDEEERSEVEESTGGGGKIEIPIQIGIIYTIYDEEGTYIGSTLGPLPYRIKSHIRDAIIYSKSSNSMRICSSHDIILRNKYTVEILEWVVVESNDDLWKKEREWIEKTDCVNINIPIRSPDESKKYHHDYYQAHKYDAEFIETIKKYRDCNKERIRRNKQQWNKENAEKMREYFKQRHQIMKSNPIYLEQRKQHKRNYNQSENGKASNNAYNNRPEVKQHRKEVYQLKKETETEEHKQNRIIVSKQWKSQKVECKCCRLEITRNSLSGHLKTTKHLVNAAAAAANL